MRILVRGEKARRWDLAEPIGAKAEAELQHLLVESPYLIPLDEINEDLSPLVLAVSEFGLPGSGQTDALAFTADGDIAIIECKLATNPESRRKVIGQILEYAAFLWGMSYQSVDEKVKSRRGQELTKLMAEAIAGEWDEKAFREGAAKTLTDGTFALVIVVDEINEELARIIRYVNERGTSGFSLHALEVRRFRSQGLEVLVPRLHGTSSKPSSPAGRRTKWSKEEFFDAMASADDDRAAPLAKEIYRWADALADRIWFGSGKDRGSFTLHFLVNGKTISVFTIYTDGVLVLNYGWLVRELSGDLMKEFHSRIVAIPSLGSVSGDFSKFPTIKLAKAFPSQKEADEFRRAVEWLHERMEPQRT